MVKKDGMILEKNCIAQIVWYSILSMNIVILYYVKVACFSLPKL